MPYIDYDENGKITGQFTNHQYENQLYFDIPDDGHIYKVDINTLKLVIDTETELKQTIQQAKLIRDNAYNNITNSILLDQLAIKELDLKLAAGTITQAEYDAAKLIYDNRIIAKAELFTTAKTQFYTATGLTEPTITA